LGKKLVTNLANEKGAAFTVALLILVAITVLGLAILITTTTEIKIAGNVKAGTEALYIAEGGMELIKSNLKATAGSNFSGTSGTSNNTQIYVVGGNPRTTITNPLNWVDTTWYKDSSLSTPLSSTNAEGSWPLYKSVSVSGGTSLITLKRPRWFWTDPKKITFAQVESKYTGENTKKVESDIEVKFENNLLVFQTFKNPSSPTSNIDNSSNNGVIIGSNGYDLGIDPALDQITGICTNDNTNKSLIIYRDHDNNLATVGWDIVGEPKINNINKTFILSGANGPYGLKGKLYSPFGGAGTEPKVTLVGSEYVPDSTIVTTLDVRTDLQGRIGRY